MYEWGKVIKIIFLFKGENAFLYIPTLNACLRSLTVGFVFFWHLLKHFTRLVQVGIIWHLHHNFSKKVVGEGAKAEMEFRSERRDQEFSVNSNVCR